MIQKLKAARAAGVPIVLVTTRDQPAIRLSMTQGWNGAVPPVVVWDSARGLAALNEAGAEALAKGGPEGRGLMPLADALTLAAAFPEKTILLVSNSHRHLNESAEAIQGLMNLRDQFKTNRRTVILLSPSPALPLELAADVLPVDDPLPEDAEIGAILDREYQAAADALTLAPCDPQTREAAIAALVGLPRFATEQAIALCLQEHKAIVPADLTERQRVAVSQIPGLSMDKGGLGLECLGGLSQVQAFFARLFGGENPPALLVRIEELEKAIAGYGTDTSGTTTGMVGVMLTAMEDHGWGGLLAAGVAGSGKSQLTKSVGVTYQRKTLTLDLGGTKGSLVGQSEQQIRQAVSTIHTIGRGRVFFIASVNNLAAVPVPLQRRFRAGTWYFDLPDAEEQAAIWRIQLRAYGLADNMKRPDYTDWTGAEIRNCCEMARNFRQTPAEVAQFIAPVAQSDPDSITRLRHAAAGKWLSASYPGFYKLPASTFQARGRSFKE